MKSKFEFKFDIEKQNKYPSYLKIWKLNLNKSTLQENIQNLIKSTLQKINSSINPNYKGIFKLFQSNSILKTSLRKNQPGSITNSSINLVCKHNYQSV